MRDLPFYQKNDYRTGFIDRFLGKRMPALEYDFEVWLGIDWDNALTAWADPNLVSKLKSGSITRGIKSDEIKLITVQDVSLPRLGYSFSNTANSGGLIESLIEPGDIIKVLS